MDLPSFCSNVPRVSHAACVKISLAGVLWKAHPVDTGERKGIGTVIAEE